MAGEGLGHPETTATTAPETHEHLFKVLVIGELGVGKTSIIKRYVHQLFSQNYRATIGVDFALKVLNWDSRTLVRLQLWDIAGQERFGNMTRVYYKEALGAFVVFDLSRSSTFEAVLKWKSDLDSKVHLPNGSPIPAVLLANKCDQKKEGSQSPSQMDQFCKDHGFTGWFETSAKDNINIDEATRFLVEKILANQQSFPREENDMDKIKLTDEPLPTKARSQCC
ncbi:ras-related protein Rab-32 [Chionomys nivalis]|uniref:ras-related protein Rab-32 n=1 Tax=Chionomys nivalis TaxID=269649 RepID=UPI002593AE98|nr:ras-related protein Rab-32 [Chionomys nivalis]